MRKITVLFAIAVLLFVAGGASAASTGDKVNFNVDKNFDAQGRTKIQSTLIKVSDKLYFYAEDQWWNSQSQTRKDKILENLNDLSTEFNGNIYPNLTSVFGSEWNPGIDNDSRITVLFEQMNSTEGGYFREADEYEKLQLPISNEREMVYLSTSYADNPDIKMILAHEFVHLITFNQKNRVFNVEEDTWLNEARADYSSKILGYDDVYENSNLQKRVRDFIENPSDSIIEWAGTKYDYASVRMFTNYLIERYGKDILTSSLKSKLVGIASINEALSKNRTTDDFSKIFANWTIALIINDCSQNQNYCYTNENLKNIKISPTLIFLPLTGNTSLTSANVVKSFAGTWHKIIGGNGKLKLEFSSPMGLTFQVPYIIYDLNDNYLVESVQLDKDKKGEINIQDFGGKYKSLIVIPSLPMATSVVEGLNLVYPYNIRISITGDDQSADQLLIQRLLEEIDSLKKQIAEILAQKGQTPVGQTCSQINVNLSIGHTGEQVSCLQQFLKNQGTSIYPEGMVTGYFGNLTSLAVVRFQEKYASEILAPFDLLSGTGYVGEKTRNKINELLRS
jgi:peptidoglycan hydrolase-like protein with peptidoglycan-binding domain